MGPDAMSELKHVGFEARSQAQARWARVWKPEHVPSRELDSNSSPKLRLLGWGAHFPWVSCCTLGSGYQARAQEVFLLGLFWGNFLGPF
jgi:hypothetical protein